MVKGEKRRAFCDRHGDWSRAMTFHIARRRFGMRLRDLGEKAKVSNDYAVAQSIRRMSKMLSKDKAPRRSLEDVVNCIKIQT